MSFSSSFASQVAAIMDVLAKAAVAEITKLLENGAVDIRLEMCRRDDEIQELKRSLTRMEVELCRAQEAAKSRATEDRQVQTVADKQSPRKDKKDDRETRAAAYLEPKSADPLCEPRCGAPASGDPRPEVKHELADEPATLGAADVTTDIFFEARERDEPIWPPPACLMFEESPVAMQQHVQAYPPPVDHYAAHAEGSYKALSTDTEDVSDESLCVPMKEEVQIRPLCMGGDASESVRDEPFRHAVGQDVAARRSNPQHAGPSLTPPHHSQRFAADAAAAEDHVVGRSSLRAKRPASVWRASQRLFVCSICHKGFLRFSQLEEHKVGHQPYKPFRCLECGKSFTQKTRLRTHQSVHTGERPFSCKICGKMFSRQDNCVRHERFHSGLKPYSCGQCGKSFTVLGNLKIHQEIHLQGR